MTMQLKGNTAEEYLALVRAFPLLSIRDDEHMDDAMAVIDHLVDKPDRTEAEEAYLDALTDLVETYDNAHVDIPRVTGVEALRSLMEENGLKQSDLAPLFGSPSIISEVLSGKRRLALTHMEKLADYFGLPITVFSGSAAGQAAGLRVYPGSNIIADECSRLLAAIRSASLKDTPQEATEQLFREWLQERFGESEVHESKPQSTATSQTERP